MSPLLALMRFGRLQKLRRTFDSLMPYLIENPSFDNAGTQALLADSGVHPPAVKDYFEALMAYGVATDWGRRPPRTDVETLQVG